MQNRYHVVPVVALILIACGGDGEPTGDVRVEVKDSAGVRIVEYSGVPEAQEPFAFAMEPVYRHGAGLGDYEFQGVNAGRLFPDGSAAVADRGNNEVVVLAPDGSTHNILAKSGQGPGEVAYPHSMYVRGRDSLFVADPYLFRISLFVGDTLARTSSLPQSNLLGVVGIESIGEVLLANRVHSRPLHTLEEEWLAGHMAKFDIETGVLDTVALYDYQPRLPPNLPSNPISAVGEVTVASGQFVYTRSDKPEITWILPDGTVTQIVRWQDEPVLLTRELLEPVEVYIRRWVQINSLGAVNPRIEENTRRVMSWYQANVGEPLPLYGSPFSDTEKRIWFPSYRLAYPQEASLYTLMSSDGEWLGNVEAPTRFRILDVSGGRVLGVVRDEMDVENVVVYELIAQSSAAR